MKRRQDKKQAGQTLIETIVAIFILTMGVTAAAGLALYAFSTSTNVTKQIIATGLAREGLEAVRNMRDTNWLKSAQNPGIDKDCYNFSSSPIGSTSPAAAICPGSITGGKCCYKNWLQHPLGYWNNDIHANRGYNFDLAGNTIYTIGVNYDSANKTWDFCKTGTACNLSGYFGLDLDKNISAAAFSGFYVPNTSSPNGNSGYYRQIMIAPINTPPFNVPDYGNKLRIISRVWWTDKKCPAHAGWLGDGKCSVQLETELTNWKNY